QPPTAVDSYRDALTNAQSLLAQSVDGHSSLAGSYLAPAQPPAPLQWLTGSWSVLPYRPFLQGHVQGQCKVPVQQHSRRTSPQAVAQLPQFAPGSSQTPTSSQTGACELVPQNVHQVFHRGLSPPLVPTNSVSAPGNYTHRIVVLSAAPVVA